MRGRGDVDPSSPIVGDIPGAAISSGREIYSYMHECETCVLKSFN